MTKTRWGMLVLALSLVALTLAAVRLRTAPTLPSKPPAQMQQR